MENQENDLTQYLLKRLKSLTIDYEAYVADKILNFDSDEEKFLYDLNKLIY